MRKINRKGTVKMKLIRYAALMIAALTVVCALLTSCADGGDDTTYVSPVITSPAPQTAETIPPITDADETTTEETKGETTAEQTAPPETETETAPATTAAETEVKDNPLGFKVDLSAYEKYMDPEDRDAYLILVNPSHPVGKDHKPDDLEPLVDTRADRSKRYMRLFAAKSLEAFLKEARANGCKDVTVTSAYRSYEYQKEIFDGDVANLMKKGYSEEEAIAIERKDTAYPGESEHQTGLAVDMHNMSSAQQAFANTYEAKWLAENCWKFGFILRYMPDKEDITTYVYEPWHFRYVGRYHAQRIYEMHMCLEEYIEYLENNP